MLTTHLFSGLTSEEIDLIVAEELHLLDAAAGATMRGDADDGERCHSKTDPSFHEGLAALLWWGMLAAPMRAATTARAARIR